MADSEIAHTVEADPPPPSSLADPDTSPPDSVARSVDALDAAPQGDLGSSEMAPEPAPQNEEEAPETAPTMPASAVDTTGKEAGAPETNGGAGNGNTKDDDGEGEVGGEAEEEESGKTSVPPKLVVLNLSFSTAASKLKEYFSQFGEIDTCVVQTDKFTGKSRGFGFISFSDNSIHVELEKRTDLELDGRAIHVRPAVPESEVNKKKIEQTNCRVCIRNLAQGVSERDLELHFTRYGKVEDVFIPSRYNGESRGLGFVTFKEPQMLDEALKERHEFLGREVNLERQDRRPRFGGGDERGRSSFSRGGDAGGGSSGTRRVGMGSMSRESRSRVPTYPGKLFVGNLPKFIEEAELLSYFSKYGRIVDVIFPRDREHQKGFAFVTFDNERSAEKVMGEAHELKGRVLTIDLAQPRQAESSYRSDGGRDRDYYASRRDYSSMDRMGYPDSPYSYAAGGGYYGSEYGGHPQRDYGYYDRAGDGRGGYRYSGRDDRYYDSPYDNRGGAYAGDRYGYGSGGGGSGGYDYSGMEGYGDAMGPPMMRGRSPERGYKPESRARSPRGNRGF